MVLVVDLSLLLASIYSFPLHQDGMASFVLDDIDDLIISLIFGLSVNFCDCN